MQTEHDCRNCGDKVYSPTDNNKEIEKEPIGYPCGECGEIFCETCYSDDCCVLCKGDYPIAFLAWCKDCNLSFSANDGILTDKWMSEHKKNNEGHRIFWRDILPSEMVKTWEP